jgi:hypothetical protein
MNEYYEALKELSEKLDDSIQLSLQSLESLRAAKDALLRNLIRESARPKEEDFADVSPSGSV